jgi:hypothetical protein
MTIRKFDQEGPTTLKVGDWITLTNNEPHSFAGMPAKVVVVKAKMLDVFIPGGSMPAGATVARRNQSVQFVCTTQKEAQLLCDRSAVTAKTCEAIVGDAKKKAVDRLTACMTASLSHAVREAKGAK